jgi:uncharacterized protein
MFSRLCKVTHILANKAAALDWINENYSTTEPTASIVIWGQSIGAGIATRAAENYLEASRHEPQSRMPVRGIILETPFLSIRSMLSELYPQKWLPYRYMGPFLRNWWDSEAALKAVAKNDIDKRISMLIIKSAKDEIVPSGQTDMLYQHALKLKMPVACQEISGALHNEATTRRQGQQVVSRFLHGVSMRSINEDTKIHDSNIAQ